MDIFRVRVVSCLVWSEVDAHIVRFCWRMVRTLPRTWNVDFALVDEREKNKIQKESYEFGALISKLQLGDDEMSIQTYIQLEGEEITKLKLSIDELVDVALEPILHKTLILMLI